MKPTEAVRRLGGATLPALLLAGLAAMFLATAWVSDDAYITFRTVDNWVNGYGLRWNVAERVQAYTHPLWMLCFSAAYYFTREPFYTSLALSVLLSIAAVGLVVFRTASGRFTAVLALLTLALSRAYVDFSTSGLENPLTHFLLALFVVVLLGGRDTPARLLRLSLIAALGALNRPDTILLFGPLLLGEVSRRRVPASLVVVAFGFLPIVLWEAFSLFYYGSLVPNTAFAKTITGIPQGEIVGQGLAYLLDSLRRDPLTLIVTLGGAAVLAATGDARVRPAAAGVAAYLLYIVVVGGDFMSGRFLSAPLFLVVALLARSVPPRSAAGRAAPVAGVLLLGGTFALPALVAGTHLETDRRVLLNPEGISDERAWYFSRAGLLAALRGKKMPDDLGVTLGLKIRRREDPLVVVGAVGFLGYYAGPGVHIIDYHALTDPLLSRLPVVDRDPLYEQFCRDNLGKPCRRPWRIGHFLRVAPPGYIATLLSGTNRIEDPVLAARYDRISLVTRGPLFSTARLAAVARPDGGGGLVNLEAFRTYRPTYEDPAQLMEFIAARPDYAFPYYCLGLVALRAGRPAEAASRFEEAVDRQPDLAEAHFQLAVANLALGDAAGAADGLKAASELGLPIDPRFEADVTRALQRGGHP